MSNEACKKKQKTEFSKKLVTWALVTTTVCLIVSYGLAFLDHDPCSELTMSVTGACIAIAVAYEAKSYGEKNSMNKYRVQNFKEAWEKARGDIGSTNCNSDLDDTVG